MALRTKTRAGLVTTLILNTLLVPQFAFVLHVPNFSGRNDHMTRDMLERNSVCFSTKCINSKSDAIASPTVAPAPAQLNALKSLTKGIALFSTIAALSLPTAAVADEYGVEVDAPTLFTGESVLICVKRGPLGACQKTELRTAANDNDKASKYFKDPGKDIEDKDAATKKVFEESNPLIAKLKQKSIDNSEQNEKIVKNKTLKNNLSASFGPFSQQVAIENANGDGFTVLENPQAMRLKKLGYIKGRQFVTQPTQEVIDENLDSPDSGLGGFFKGIFGNGDDLDTPSLSSSDEPSVLPSPPTQEVIDGNLDSPDSGLGGLVKGIFGNADDSGTPSLSPPDEPSVLPSLEPSDTPSPVSSETPSGVPP